MNIIVYEQGNSGNDFLFYLNQKEEQYCGSIIDRKEIKWNSILPENWIELERKLKKIFNIK